MAKPKADRGTKRVEDLARKLEELRVEYVPIDSIRPNSYNPNRQSEHEFDLLKRSMTEDGFTQPIIVHRETQQIVDGEHRWRASRDLGMQTIPVVFVDMTGEQMRIATLRHNRARGSEDIELSAQVLRDLQELGALGWAQESLKLSDVEIQRLLEDIPAPEALADDEFGEAWVPGGLSSRDGGMTMEASNALRDREKRLVEAKSEEERQAVQREKADLYRVSLTFTGEQADIVRAVLGNTPADRLLELCREATSVAVGA